MKLIEITNSIFFEAKKKAYSGKDTEGEIDFIIESLKQDCQPYLSQFSFPLWRGTEGVSSNMTRELSPSFLIGSVRNNRKPRDSSKVLHDTMNNYFKKKVGIPVRSASLFTYGMNGLAENYGDNVFAIIPIGEFHYVWSPIIDDLTANFEINQLDDNKKLGPFLKKTEETTGIDFQELKDLESSEYHKQNYPKFLTSLFDNYGDELFKFDQDLKNAVKTMHEVMLVCDKYYAINTNEINEMKINIIIHRARA